MVRVAVLDDYQGVALKMADWSVLDGRCEITVFHDHLADKDEVARRLEPFDVVCVMRERTPIGRSLMERLPRLRLICSTGRRNAAIDEEAARERGIAVVHTGYSSDPTIEMTWALILGLARNLVPEAIASVKEAGSAASPATCTAKPWACSGSATSAARSRASVRRLA